MNDLKLSRSEKETSIIFTEAEDYATVETYNRRLKKRLEELCKKHNGFYEIENTGELGVFKIPKKYVTVQKPRAKSNYHKNIAGSYGAMALKKWHKGQKETQN